MAIDMKTSTLLVVLLAGLTSCSTEQETRPVVQDIRELVFASGQVEWKDSWTLVAQTDGILQNLSLETGDEVQAGQLLGTVHNPANAENLKSAGQQVRLTEKGAAPLEQQIRQNIVFAEQKYQQDKLQRERYQRLYEKQSVSRQEFENMKLAEENALSQLNVLKEQLASVKLQNEQTLITARNQQENSRILNAYNALRASEKGKVIGKQKFEGDFVRRGDVIATIADPARVEIVLNVDESTIGKVKTGQTVFVRLNTEKDKVYTARVTEIVAAFDPATQSFICKARFDDPAVNPLYGTQLEGNIQVGEKKQALLVPRSSMGYGNTVRIKGKEEPVVLQTGIVSTDYVEVLGGITSDDILLPVKR